MSPYKASPLLPEPGRVACELRKQRADRLREPPRRFQQCIADVMPLGRLDAHLSEQRLQAELHDLLRLADHVRVGPLTEKHRERLQPRRSLQDAALREREIRYGKISKTSPGS